MACHWAYDTKGNKIVYGVIIFFMLVGKVLIAAGLIGGYSYKDCFHKYGSCIDAGNDSASCTNSLSYCKMRLWLNLIVAGAIIWGFGVSFTVYMCFFSNPPRPNPPPQTVAVSMQPMLPYPHTGPYPQEPGYMDPQAPVMGMPVTGYPASMYPASPFSGQPWPQPQLVTATVSSPAVRRQLSRHNSAGRGEGSAGQAEHVALGVEAPAGAWK